MQQQKCTEPVEVTRSNHIHAQQKQKAEELSFDNTPLVIFSKTGESNIIDVQLKELGSKLREGLISVDRSLDDNVANLKEYIETSVSYLRILEFIPS